MRGVVNGDVNPSLASVVELNRGVIIHILIGCLEEVKGIGGKAARSDGEMAGRICHRCGDLLHPAARHQELKRLVRNRAAGGAVTDLSGDVPAGGKQSPRLNRAAQGKPPTARGIWMEAISRSLQL